MESSFAHNAEKAGEITRKSVAFARSIVKRGMLLRDLADQIEKHIISLGGFPAFPVNLSINEVAAHATPSYDSVETAHGLLKVDLGVHVEGAVADTAFSVDLDNDPRNTALIKAAEAGLSAAVRTLREGIVLNDLGSAIDAAVRAEGATTVINLSGHAIEEYDVHAGMTIPNHANGDDTELEEGLYAVEPFATDGSGRVVDGRPSGIYQVIKQGNVRDAFAREVLSYIIDTYQTLPFCSRWIHAKFGSRGLIALRFIEQTGVLHHYAQLVEAAGGRVAQAEHTFLVTKKETKQLT